MQVRRQMFGPGSSWMNHAMRKDLKHDWPIVPNISQIYLALARVDAKKGLDKGRDHIFRGFYHFEYTASVMRQVHKAQRTPYSFKPDRELLRVFVEHVSRRIRGKGGRKPAERSAALKAAQKSDEADMESMGRYTRWKRGYSRSRQGRR